MCGKEVSSNSKTVHTRPESRTFHNEGFRRELLMNVEKVAELQLVDDGLVYPLGISYLVFPFRKIDRL